MAVYPQEGFVEDCWFIFGKKIGTLYVGWVKHHSSGSTGSVSFDLQKVIDHPRFIGWIHTHPGDGFVTPSSTDQKTMRGWVITQGRPMLCGISSGSKGAMYEYRRKYPYGPIVYSERHARIFKDKLLLSWGPSWKTLPAK